MKNIQKTAVSAVLLAAFAQAQAGGNNHNHHNDFNNHHNDNGSTEITYNGRQSQDTHVNVHNSTDVRNSTRVNNNVTGGAGYGGQGGAGYGYGYGAGGQGGQGGNANNEGSTNSNSAATGPVTVEGDDYDAPTPIGMAPSVFIQPTGDCGEGWSLSIGAPYSALGGGKSSQDRVCLGQKAAVAAMNAGLVAKDTGMVAAGLAALREIHTEFDNAAKMVSDNLVKPCAVHAGSISAVLLTGKELQCQGSAVKIAP